MSQVVPVPPRDFGYAPPAAPPEQRLGAHYLGDGLAAFTVWAPAARLVQLRILWPDERTVPMTPGPGGYHHVVAADLRPGALYLFRLDHCGDRPDPASRSQPKGVHGPSELVDPSFEWTDSDWSMPPLHTHVFYELHVGAYTDAGTFDALIEHLPRLRELGVTAIEVMPIAQFPGARNWGYDGVFPFAAQDSYGGLHGFKRFVNACHGHGLAVILDVVYNHLGPEGNRLADFGPYFTDRYHTPWGEALNFDGAGSDEVRRFFIENALFWVTDCHVDGLRLDAVHAIYDQTATPFLADLAAAVSAQARRLNRRILLIPESSLNDPRLIRPPERGGFGLDAQWNDEFHHSIHALLTGERDGYYVDFGSIQHLAAAFRNGYVYTGQHSAFRRHRHGAPCADVPAERFIVFSQNHDQIGNRMLGDRPTGRLSFEARKLAAGTVTLSPFLPLLFMGEEYDEPAPFPYFVSHSDPELVEAVRRGRREEFAQFEWEGEPPDPQDAATFCSARLDHSLRRQGLHKLMHEFYTELLRLRRELEPLARLDRRAMHVTTDQDRKVLCVRRRAEGREAAVIYNYSSSPVSLTLDFPAGDWDAIIDSAAERWAGPGSRVPGTLHSTGKAALTLSPQAFVLFQARGRR